MIPADKFVSVDNGRYLYWYDPPFGRLLHLVSPSWKALPHMVTAINDEPCFWYRVSDSINAHITVLDKTGKIVAHFHESSLKENQDGKHRDTDSQVHGGTSQAGGSAYQRAIAQGLAAVARQTTISGTVAAYQNAISAAQGTYLTVPPHWLAAPIPNAGIKAGEIIGYRCWKYLGAGMRLSSIVIDALWDPETPVTLLNDQDIDGYGVHAFKDADLVPLYIEELKSCVSKGHDIYATSFVLGKVALWGDVIEHKYGWRGEFAAVESLDTFVGDQWIEPADDILARLRKMYGVENAS